jgi:hypothetical protein
VRAIRLRAALAGGALVVIVLLSILFGWLRMDEALPGSHVLQFENISLELETPALTLFEPHFAREAVEELSGNASTLSFQPCSAVPDCTPPCKFDSPTAISISSSAGSNLGLDVLTWSTESCDGSRLGFHRTPSGMEAVLSAVGPGACMGRLNTGHSTPLSGNAAPGGHPSTAGHGQLSLRLNRASQGCNIALGASATTTWRTPSIHLKLGSKTQPVLSPEGLRGIRKLRGKLASAMVIEASDHRECRAASGQSIELTLGSWALDEFSIKDAQLLLTVQPGADDVNTCPRGAEALPDVGCAAPACGFNQKELLARSAEVFGGLSGVVALILSIVGFQKPGGDRPADPAGARSSPDVSATTAGCRGTEPEPAPHDATHRADKTVEPPADAKAAPAGRRPAPKGST